MVTVEAALVLPTVLILLAIGLRGVTGVWAQLRCAAAAQLGAQAISAGAGLAEVRRMVSADAPSGSVVVTSISGREVSVLVRWQPAVSGGLLGVLPIDASATDLAYRPP